MSKSDVIEIEHNVSGRIREWSSCIGTYQR